MLTILRSPFAILRCQAAKTFAIGCEVLPTSGMLFVIENILPLLADALSETNRMGAVEAVHCEETRFAFHTRPHAHEHTIIPFATDIVQRLEIKILPYILFLVIPVLGRMTDSSNEVRLVATNIFATLVKLIPLEVSPSSASHSTCGTDGCDRRAFQILKGCLLIYSQRGRQRGNSFSSCSIIGKWNPIPCRSPSRPIYDPISEMELAG
jgi:hypothetical protein